MKTSPTNTVKQVTFSNETSIRIIPAVDKEELSLCFYSSAEIRRFQVFEQFRREKQLVQGITQLMMMTQSSSRDDDEKCRKGLVLEDFSKMSLAKVQAVLAESRAF